MTMRVQTVSGLMDMLPRHKDSESGVLFRFLTLNGVLFGLLPLKMYLFARVCHVRNHICIPSKCDFFLLRNRITTRFAGIFRLSDEKPEVSFFCQKLRKKRKIVQILTNVKKAHL